MSGLLIGALFIPALFVLVTVAIICREARMGRGIWR